MLYMHQLNIIITSAKYGIVVSQESFHYFTGYWYQWTKNSSQNYTMHLVH